VIETDTPKNTRRKKHTPYSFQPETQSPRHILISLLKIKNNPDNDPHLRTYGRALSPRRMKA